MTYLSTDGAAPADFIIAALLEELFGDVFQKPAGVLCSAAALAEFNTPRDS